MGPFGWLRSRNPAAPPAQLDDPVRRLNALKQMDRFEYDDLEPEDLQTILDHLGEFETAQLKSLLLRDGELQARIDRETEKVNAEVVWTWGRRVKAIAKGVASVTLGGFIAVVSGAVVSLPSLLIGAASLVGAGAFSYFRDNSRFQEQKSKQLKDFMVREVKPRTTIRQELARRKEFQARQQKKPDETERSHSGIQRASGRSKRRFRHYRDRRQGLRGEATAQYRTKAAIKREKRRADQDLAGKNETVARHIERINELEASLGQHRKKGISDDHKIDDLEYRLRELSAKFGDVDAERQGKDVIIGELSDELAVLEEENARLTGQLGKANEEVENMSRMVADLASQLKSWGHHLQAQEQEADRERIQLETKLEQMQSDATKMGLHLQNSRYDQLTTMGVLGNVSRERDELVSWAEELQHRIVEFERDRSGLLEQGHAQEAALKELERENESLRLHYEQFKTASDSDRGALQFRITELEGLGEKWKVLHEQAAEELANLRKETMRQQLELGRANEIIEEARAELSHFQGQHREETEQARRLQQQLDKAFLEANSLRVEKANLAREKNRLQQQYTELKASFDVLGQAVTAEKESYQDLVLQKDAAMLNLNSRLEGLEQQLAAVKQKAAEKSLHPALKPVAVVKPAVAPVAEPSLSRQDTELHTEKMGQGAEAAARLLHSVSVMTQTDYSADVDTGCQHAAKDFQTTCEELTPAEMLETDSYFQSMHSRISSMKSHCLNSMADFQAVIDQYRAAEAESGESLKDIKHSFPEEVVEAHSQLSSLKSHVTRLEQVSEYVQLLENRSLGTGSLRPGTASLQSESDALASPTSPSYSETSSDDYDAAQAEQSLRNLEKSLRLPLSDMQEAEFNPEQSQRKELRQIVGEQQLYEGLDEEERLELDQAIKTASLRKDWSGSLEEFSDDSVSDDESEPPSPVLRERVSSVRLSVRRKEEVANREQQWQFAEPLDEKEKGAVKGDWSKCVSQQHAGGLEALPDHERKRLEYELHRVCRDGDERPSKEKLAEALQGYKSFIMECLPQTCQALLGSAGVKPEPLKLEKNFSETVSATARKLGYQPGSTIALGQMAEFMAGCMPVLASSPYDDEGYLPSRKKTLEEKLESLQQHKATCREVYEKEQEQLNSNLFELYYPISEELNVLEQKLIEHLGVVDSLIENDFSHSDNLIKGQERLIKGAIEAVSGRMRELEADRYERKWPWSKPSERKAYLKQRPRLIHLKTRLEGMFATLPRRQDSPGLVMDLVTRLHTFRSELEDVLKAEGVSAAALDKGIETALNTNPWKPIRKKFIVRHAGEFHPLQVDNIPAGAVHWSEEKGVMVADIDMPADQAGVDVCRLDHGGRSSMSASEKDHAVNPWIVRMYDEEGRKVMAKVRTGVPVPFPLIGVESDEAVLQATLQRLHETITLMVLEAKGDTPEFREAVNSGKTIDFDAIHTSLLSPDKFRQMMNGLAEVLPKGSALRKKIKKKLDNEAAMLKILEKAIEQLSQAPIPIKFYDEHGQEKVVRVNYDGTLFACPANKMGQERKLLYRLWKAADKVNRKAASKMFGGTDVRAPLEGRVGRYIQDQKHLHEDRALVEKGSRIIQYILAKKLHHKNNDMALLLPVLLNGLSQYIADGYHDFCKSGKDRTGYVNMLCLVMYAEMLITRDIEAMDAPQSADKRFNTQSALGSTGQSEIVLQNIANPGMKTDQGDPVTGLLYRLIHYSRYPAL